MNIEAINDFRRPYRTDIIPKPTYKPRLSNNPFNSNSKIHHNNDTIKTKQDKTDKILSVNNDNDKDDNFNNAIAELDKFIIEQYEREQKQR